MANSTTTLDTIQPSQAGKEITANQLFDAMSTAAIFGRRASTTSALTWGYYGGGFLVGGTTPTQIANGTIALSASSTNYIEVEISTGNVVKNTTGWTGAATHYALYKIVCGTSTVTSYEDFRSMRGPKGDPGATGATGGMTYSGSGAPSAGTGVNGDLYINTANGDLYQKAAGSWGSPIGNIKGPTGATGASGGAYITGAGAPSAGTGNNGDLYVNTSNGDLYQKVAGSWGSVLGNLTGPAGAAGGGLQSVQATFPGTLTTLTGTIRWYPRSAITLTNVFVAMGTAPGAGGAVFNVRKNGTAIFTGSKPTVASGANTSGANAISVSMTTTDYLTVDVETASGGDATLRIDYS